MDEISLLKAKIHMAHMENDESWQLILEQKQKEMDFMKENFEKKMEEMNEKNSDLENRYIEEKRQLKNEAQKKLNEKLTERNEEFKRKLEERVISLTSNLKYEMEQKEKDHLYKMERKDMELATMEESLARAQMRKNEIGELMRLIGNLIKSVSSELFQ